MFKEYLKEIRSEESKCKKLTQLKFKNELNFFNNFLYFYTDQLKMTRICQHSRFSVQENPIFLLNVRIIKSFFCANNLVKKGYYNEAIVIQRSIYESIYLCKYLIKNPKLAVKWSKGERFSPSTVAKDLEISQDMKKIYDTFCEFTHPNVSSIADLITIEKRSLIYEDFQKRDTTVIHTCPIFNEELSFGSIQYQLVFLQMASDNFFEFFKDKNWKDVNISHRKRRNELQEEFFKIVASWKGSISG